MHTVHEPGAFTYCQLCSRSTLFRFPTKKEKKRATLFIVMMIVRATCGRLPCQQAMKDAAHDLYAFSSYSRLHLLLKVQVSGRANPPLSGDSALLVRSEGRKASGDVGGQQQEGGLRHRRQRVHRLRARQDAVGERVCREDDGQEPRFDSRIPLFQICACLVSRSEGEIF